MPINKNENTLKSWASGKMVSIALGLAVGAFLWKTGLIQKATSKLFTKKTDTSNNNIAHGKKTQKALIAIALAIFLLLAIAYFWKD